MDSETSGILGNRVGSLFAGRSSFHPGEPRDGLAHMSNGVYARVGSYRYDDMFSDHFDFYICLGVLFSKYPYIEESFSSFSVLDFSLLWN